MAPAASLWAVAVLAIALFAAGIAGRLAPAAQAQGADPAATKIESFYASLTDAMKSGGAVQARFAKLDPAVKSTFNLPAMTQLIVGPSWGMMSEADRQKLTDAFGRMTTANYAANFRSFNNQVFKVDPKVQVRGADKVVMTTFTPPGGAPIALNYRMREAGGEWKVIDIFLAGAISELATKRSEYAATLASGGADALAKKLTDTADKQLAG